AGGLFAAWGVWARRCPLPAFVKLARSVTDHRAGIQATLLHGLSNGLIESVNTKLRLLTRIAFGFHSPDALISLAMLALGGLCPPLPGRALPTHGCSRRAQFRELMAADAEVSDLVLRVLLARRQSLRQGEGARTLEILGSQLSPATHALRTWASRQELPHTWLDFDDLGGQVLANA